MKLPDKNDVQNNGKETLANGYDILALAFPMLESVKHHQKKKSKPGKW